MKGVVAAVADMAAAEVEAGTGVPEGEEALATRTAQIVARPLREGPVPRQGTLETVVEVRLETLEVRPAQVLPGRLLFLGKGVSIQV